jgi:hypothetical protein
LLVRGGGEIGGEGKIAGLLLIGQSAFL